MKKEIQKPYSLGEAAEYLGITYRTALMYVKTGRLKGYKVAGRWRITEDDLKFFMSGGDLNGKASYQPSLKIDPADIREFYRMTYGRGLTPEKVLEGFIQDFTASKDSHGADQVLQAGEYVESAYLDIPISFTGYLIRQGLIKYLISLRADDPAIFRTDLAAHYKAYQGAGGAQGYKEGIKELSAYLIWAD